MENSYFWSCANVGDGGADSFSQEKVMTMLGMVSVDYNPEVAGVIPWKSTNTTILETLGMGALAPTGELLPSSNGITVTIGSGLASVGGIFYVNAEALMFNIAANKSGLANAVDRIVLRRNIVSQTVRLVYVPATFANTTAALQNTDTTWDVPIARIVLDGSGNYSGIRDDRRYVISPTSDRVLLEKRILTSNVSTLTFQNISPVYSKIELEIAGAVLYASTPGTFPYISADVTINNITSNWYTAYEEYFDTVSNTKVESYTTNTKWKLRFPVGRVASSMIGINNNFHMSMVLNNPPRNTSDYTNLFLESVSGRVFSPKMYELSGVTTALDVDIVTGRLERIDFVFSPVGGVATYLSAGTEINLYGIK